mmetsp:Transcript_12104/g.28179  ORF Transcript_12104/g.28179 Transcript_12104/m.28179 type:complete len:200 (+) Transcript_12104:2316-2915(+)
MLKNQHLLCPSRSVSATTMHLLIRRHFHSTWLSTPSSTVLVSLLYGSKGASAIQPLRSLLSCRALTTEPPSASARAFIALHTLPASGILAAKRACASSKKAGCIRLRPSAHTFCQSVCTIDAKWSFSLVKKSVGIAATAHAPSRRPCNNIVLPSECGKYVGGRWWVASGGWWVVGDGVVGDERSVLLKLCSNSTQQAVC